MQYSLRRLLYAFKRQWPAEISYVEILESLVDDDTGVRTVKRRFHNVTGVRLPQNQMRKFIQDIGYLAANKNFTYGGLNDYNTITFLIDTSDLPLADLNGYVVFNGKRYERHSLDNLDGTIWVLTVKGVEGANPFGQLSEATYNKLVLMGKAGYELN